MNTVDAVKKTGACSKGLKFGLDTRKKRSKLYIMKNAYCSYSSLFYGEWIG
jgi:hypothetical protein